MSALQNERTVDGNTPTEESPSQQLAGRISAELVSKQFTTEAKRVSLVSKIATGQMGPEDWRIMAASALRTESQATEEEKSVDADGGGQL